MGHFEGSIPDSIRVWRPSALVEPFIAGVMLCFKCGLIGHVSKFCRGQENWLTCSEPRHTDAGGKCKNTQKCMNCSDEHHEHPTLDRNCPAHQKKAAIKRVIAYECLPYLSAKRLLKKTKEATKLKCHR